MTRQVRLLTLSALMCALIIVSTLWLKFTIPGTDVMFSSQVFFVLLCGLLLGSAVVRDLIQKREKIDLC